jgi:AcrR family transcriptional regulator
LTTQAPNVTYYILRNTKEEEQLKAMTKREIQASETRQRIIRSAVGLFARFGYHKTTVSEIAQVAGVTTGALFHHFGSKEDLLNAVIDWLSKGIHAYSEHLKKEPNPSFSTISDMLSLMCSHYERYPEATICLAMLATEFSGSHHPVEERIRSVYEVFIQALTPILATNPRIRNPRAAAIAFIGSVQGIAIQAIMREKEVDIRTLAEGFKSMLQAW